MTNTIVPLVLICDGDPTDPQTNSGVAKNFIDALRERSDVRVVASVSSRPPRLVRLLVQVLAFHPNRTIWRQRARRGTAARWARTLTRDLRVRRIAVPPSGVLVHVRSFYAPSRHPYVSFIDTTVLDDDRNWSTSEDGMPRVHPPRAYVMERRFYTGARFIATAAHAAQRSLVSDYGIEPHRIAIVGGGTNAFSAGYAAANREHEGAVQILFVGRDLQRKGGDLLIEAVRSLVQQGADVRLVMSGCTVPNPPEFVTATGFVHDRLVLRELYAQSDMFSLPARWEPYGLVVQEAMAFGLPVVVTDVGELPSIVLENETGLVVPPEDVKALTHAVRRLVEDPALRLRLGERGRLRAMSELTWAQVADRFVRRFETSDAAALPPQGASVPGIRRPPAR